MSPGSNVAGMSDVDAHAERFDAKAADYDDSNSPEYRACLELVIDHARELLRRSGDGVTARSDSGEVLLDLGTGTGAVALALAGEADRVVGRDVSEGMLERARRKADERGVGTVSFGTGRFREPAYEGPVDVVTSNYALHHLDDAGKREAIGTIAALEPRAFVLGDLIYFAEPDEPAHDPSVDDPATVGHLADALTDAGFVLTAVERVTDGIGVLVAERAR